MLTTVPSGFMLQPNSVGDTGPSNLAKAAHDDGGAGARAALERAGFLRGFQRLWTNPDETAQNFIILYQFKSKAGATLYARRTRALLPRGLKKGHRAIALAVTGIPDAFGFVGPGPSGGNGAVVVFQHGVYLIDTAANTNAGSASDEGAAVEALALAQYARLQAIT
jgi:hypothetical protein